MEHFTTAQIITWGLALLGMVLAGVGYPYLKRRFFDPTMSLLAEIRLSPTKTKALVASKLSPVLQAMPWQEREIFQGLSHDGGYVSVVLRNVGKKKVSGVTVTVGAETLIINGTYQVDDDVDLKPVKNGLPIPVGDIAPGQNRVLHIWSASNYSDYPYNSIKSMFSVSADEFHLTRKTYPLP
ncbi:MAG: hypothetical protein EOS21_07310 [Mesorhizobium sp.]|nr:MAG: hypothetical protein EOS21_07310 [Mesorhizobium sp.]